MARATDTGLRTYDHGVSGRGAFMTGSASGDGKAFDGKPACALCANADPAVSHEWCAISDSLVCTRCCEGVSGFDPGRLMSAFAKAAAVLSPSEVADICNACPRRRPSGLELTEDDEAAGAC